MTLFSVSVSGVVVDAGERVLLQRRADNGVWELPGGVLEHDESVVDGVRREVFEETGVVVEVRDLTGVYRHRARDVVALVFRCTPVGGVPTIGAESTAVEWVSVSEALSRVPEVFTHRITDAFQPGRAPVREHDGRQWLNPSSSVP